MVADKESTVRLLKTAKGQIEGILKMIEEDRYCVDVSNQILATTSILNKANKQIIKCHMECCVKDALQNGDGQEKIDEMLSIFDKLAK